MKRLSFLFLILFLVCGNVSAAEEEVYLDLNPLEVHRYDTGEYKYENKKLDYDEEEENYLKPSFHTMKKMFDEDFYKPKNVSTKKEKKFGKATLGTKSDIKINPNDATSTRTLYSDYALTDKMSVGTSYSAKSSDGFKGQQKGTVSGSAEYKFTEKTSLKNIYSTNLNDNSNKGEVQLKYKPFKDDRMDMNVGAGQRTFDNGQQSSSQVNFGTNFRF